jgi:hypothetical protein
VAWDRDTPARAIDRPEPGLFRLRLRRGGPWTACKITCADGLWQAWVNDIPQGPANADPWLVGFMERIWTGAQVIDAVEYAHLRRLHEWAIRHAQWHPAARPSEPYNPGTARPRF